MKHKALAYREYFFFSRDLIHGILQLSIPCLKIIADAKNKNKLCEKSRSQQAQKGISIGRLSKKEEGVLIVSNIDRGAGLLWTIRDTIGYILK